MDRIIITGKAGSSRYLVSYHARRSDPHRQCCTNAKPKCFITVCCLLIPLLAIYVGQAQEQARSKSLTFQLEDNLIRVPVSVNGHTARAVLDSGSGALVLDRSFALSIGIKPGLTSGDVAGGGGPSAMYPISVSDLRFGPEHLTGLSGMAVDPMHTSQSAGFPVDVLLGIPVFTPQPLRIDYPGRLITFLPANEPVACTDPIPFTLVNGTPSIAVALQATSTGPSRVLHLIVDLGTRHNVAMIGGSFLTSPEGKDLIAHSHPQQIGNGTGGSMQGYLSKVSSMRIGSYELISPTIALTADLKFTALGIADGTLGVPAWIDGTLTLDYAHDVLCLP
jgi:hypothetical protein